MIVECSLMSATPKPISLSNSQQKQSKEGNMQTLLLSLAILGSAICQEFHVSYNVKSTGVQGCQDTQELRESIHNDITTLINQHASSTCGCGGPGWRRVAYLNMSDTTQTCPSAWELFTTPRRSCGRPSNAGRMTCYSVTFPNQGIQYSQVCGRIIGYQFGQTQAFVAINKGRLNTIDGPYVDGVSLTYGSPRQHIWSFAAAVHELSGSRFLPHGNYNSQCECTDTTDLAMLKVPSYVGNDYFCETGVPTGQYWEELRFYSDDPLWDGKGCGQNSTCCTFNSPPWFCKQLPQSTSADLEARLCSQDAALIENTPIEQLEIYTQ